FRVGGKAVPPSRTCLRQFHRSRLPQIPRFATRLLHFPMPGSLRTVSRASAPSRYSMGVFSLSRPEISWKAATSISSIVTRKLKALYGFLLGRSVAVTTWSPWGPGGRGSRLAGEAGDLLDAEDDELGRADDGDADVADEAAVLDVVGRHGGLVAADE